MIQKTGGRRLFRPFGRLHPYMRLLSLVLLLGMPAAWAAADPVLAEVKAIYLMPMGSGLDQYLATQLTQERVFDVVTDPALADAVFTDRLGPVFEQALAQLYPPPPEEKVKAQPEKPKPDPAKKAGPGDSVTIGAAMADRPELGPRVSSFSRGRGNVFLVDRRTKRVLWSDFQRPKSSRADEVNRAAEKIISQLEGDLQRLRKPQK
jgi:hypothetical protein